MKKPRQTKEYHHKDNPNKPLMGLTASKRWLSNFLVYSVLIGWVGMTVLATGWILITSLKTNKELFADVWDLPTKLHWENYIRAWQMGGMGILFPNSIIVSVIAVLLLAILGSMAAYVLSRFKWKGRNLVLWTIIAGNAIPVQLITVPLYILLYQIDLLNSLPALAVIYVSISLPFTIFVMVGFFRSLPTELEEAGILDGASNYAVFWKIMLPLARPGLITVSIFNFIAIWNEYMLALLLVQDSSRMTLPLGFYRLKAITTYNGDWVAMMAGLIILLVPTLVIFALLQEFITEGLTAGALKGG